MRNEIDFSTPDPLDFELYLQQFFQVNDSDETEVTDNKDNHQEPYWLDYETNPMEYYFGQNPHTGEFLVPEEIMRTRQPVWIVPSTELDDPTQTPYRYLKPKIKNFSRFAAAIVSYSILTNQDEPYGDTQLTMSSMELKVPQVYSLLGYDTGTAAHSESITPEAQERINQGILAHKMRTIMHIAARGQSMQKPLSLLPTVPYEELAVIKDVLEQTEHADLDVRIMQSWDILLSGMIETGQLSPDMIEAAHSPLMTDWQLLLAHHYTHQFSQRQPLPEYDLNNLTFFEPTLLFKISPAGLYIRMQPDQIVFTPQGPLVIEFKTSHVLNTFKKGMERSNDQQTRQTAKTKRDVALRQNQSMMLAAAQLTNKTNLLEDIENGVYRGPGENYINVVKRNDTPPKKNISLVYEMIHRRPQKGTTLARSNEISYSSDQWLEY